MKDSANSLVCLAFGWFAIKERILPIADFASGGQTPPSRLLSVRFWFAIKEREFFATLGLVIPLSQILPIADFASGGQTPPSRLLSVRFLVCYKGEGIFCNTWVLPVA